MNNGMHANGPKGMSGSENAVRLPKNYQLVYDIVREQGAGMHATMSAIFSEAKRRQPAIGYSTVYRALDRLRDLRLILEVKVLGAGSSLYELVRSSHAHFLCTRCGRVEDVDYALPTAMIEELATERGADITDASVTFQGICAHCRERNSADPLDRG